MSDVYPVRRLYDTSATAPRVIVFTPMLFDMPDLSKAYAEAAFIDSLLRGEAPIVPELLWGLEGDIGKIVELLTGWIQVAEKVVLYVDHPPFDEASMMAKAAADIACVELEERSVHGEFVKED